MGCQDPMLTLSLRYLEQLQEGTAKVRSILGPDMIVSDDDIQESLWYYYYDVEKTVNYILSMTLINCPESKGFL